MGRGKQYDLDGLRLERAVVEGFEELIEVDVHELHYKMEFVGDWV